MREKWKKVLAVVCTVLVVVTMPGMHVLADEMQGEAIVTEAEISEKYVDFVDSSDEDVAEVVEENIDQEEEEVVGEGPVQVGDGVTATFDANTGAVEFTSQDGELWTDWADKLDTNREKIKSIEVVSGRVYLPSDSSGFDGNYRMFGGLSGLINMDLSGFNTSNITNMYCMFYDCRSLISLDLSGVETSNVTNMGGMFMYCDRITSLDLSSFDTSNVTDMANMFKGCLNLSSLDVSRFDTSNVTDMNGMFWDCSSLTSLDVSGFDTSNVTVMSDLFANCSSLTKLDVSGFNTSNVTDLSSMFSGCSSLTCLNVSGFDTSHVTSMSRMFAWCNGLTSLDLSSFDALHVMHMGSISMFDGCNNLGLIITPKRISESPNLPREMYDSSGILYTSLPIINCSIVLANTQQMAHEYETQIYHDDADAMLSFFLSTGHVGYVHEFLVDMYKTDTGYLFQINNNDSSYGYSTGNLEFSQYKVCTSTKFCRGESPESRCICFYPDRVTGLITEILGEGRVYCEIWKHANRYEFIVYEVFDEELPSYRFLSSDIFYLSQEHDSDYVSINKGSFCFRSGLKNDDSLDYSFDYDDKWLFSNSLDDRYKLMKTSIRVAMAAFGTKTDNDYGAENIKKMMDTMKFTYSEDTSIKYEKPENDSIGSAIGMKNIKKQDGSTASIILVALRGGGYGAEWGGNFRVGAPNIKDHEGFRQAANIVDARLEEFYKTNRDIINRSNDVRIWVTGYSRAAATANLVAADLIDGKCDIEINPEKVIAFCFECPRNTRRVGIALSKYNNIINVVNPIDFVPKLALRGWGFTRYGTTYYIPSKETTAKYEKKYKNEMRSKYKALCDNNSISFKKSFVHEAFGQGSILDAYVDFLATYIRRDEYWSTYQETFMSIGRSKLGGSGTPDWGAAAPELIKILGITSLQPVKTTEVVSMFLKGNTGPGPSAHYHELCMSWIDSLGSFSNFQTSDNSWYRKFLVNCPVEVIVTDRSGSIVGHIVNDTVEEIEDGIAVRIDGDGQKVFILPPDDEYDVKVIAEEDATINYSIEEYNIDSNAIEKVINYKKIDATQGEAIVGTASIGNSIDDAEYTLKYAEKEEMIVPDEVKTGDDIEMFAVEVSCAGQGSVTGGGVYTNGEFAQVTAVPDDGFEFIGWFVENELVSKEEKYRFGVEKNILLEARFSNSSSEIEPTPIPTITPIPTPTTIPNAPGARFSDVQDPSHPYYKAIYWAAEKKITGGYKDGTFGINKPCTRGHAVMFLWKMEGAPAPKDAEKTPFPDVPKTHPYYKAVLWAQQKGITKGYTSGPNKGKFGIDDTCTRGQIMTFIWNYKGKPTPKAESKSPFSDVPTTHPYYKAILWGSKNGVTKGYTSGPNAGKFGINDSCTRGQIVKFLYNIR